MFGSRSLQYYLTKIRSVPLVCCLPKMSPSSSTHTDSQIATWRRPLTWTHHDFSFDLRLPSTGKMFIWSPAFLPEPGSTRYSSAPSFTTVWSNYQTSYNDFFEVYITETVTLSPNYSKWSFRPIQLYQSISQQCHVTKRSLSLVKIAFSWCPLW